VINGFAPALLVGIVAQPGCAQLEIIGQGPQIVVSENQVIEVPGIGTIVVSGFEPAALLSSLEPGAGTIEIVGLAPSILVAKHYATLQSPRSDRNTKAGAATRHNEQTAKRTNAQTAKRTPS
jgi:hypothetical protein